jgi:hypothetical protein
LLRIEKYAFCFSGLISLTIPTKTEFIDGSAFEDTFIINLAIAPGNRRFEMRDSFLVQIPEQRLARYFGTDIDVVVPADIRVFGRSCFSRCSHLTSIVCGDDSELREIEHRAMFDIDVPFHIPASVQTINGSAFAGPTMRCVTVDKKSRHFRIDGEFLLDYERKTLIRYLGGASRLTLDGKIEVIGQGCFYSHRFLIRCNLEEGSQARAVMEEAFWLCSVLDIRLPSSVGYIGRKAFVQGCRVSMANPVGADDLPFRKWLKQRKGDPLAVFGSRPE